MSAWTWTLFAFWTGWSSRASRTRGPGRTSRTLLTCWASGPGRSRDTRVAFVTLWSRRPRRAFKTATKCETRKNRNCSHDAHANSFHRLMRLGERSSDHSDVVKRRHQPTGLQLDMPFGTLRLCRNSRGGCDDVRHWEAVSMSLPKTGSLLELARGSIIACCSLWGACGAAIADES